MPTTQQEWDDWAFSLQAELRDITRRLLETKNVFIPQFALDPFNPEEPGVTLFLLQEWMNQIAVVLSIPTYDFIDVDLNDMGQRVSWIFLLSQSVRQAANQVGV